MTKSDVLKLLSIVVGAFPNWKPNDMTAPIWFGIFQDIEYDLAEKALISFLNEDHEFAPNPGQIKARVNRWLGVSQTLFEEVWLKVLEDASSGEISREILNNPAACKAIRFVGWHRLRHCDVNKELPFVKKDFLTALKTFTERKETERQIESLGVRKLLAELEIKTIT